MTKDQNLHSRFSFFRQFFSGLLLNHTYPLRQKKFQYYLFMSFVESCDNHYDLKFK